MHVVDSHHLELLQEPWVETVADIMSRGLDGDAESEAECSFVEPRSDEMGGAGE